MPSKLYIISSPIASHKDKELREVLSTKTLSQYIAAFQLRREKFDKIDEQLRIWCKQYNIPFIVNNSLTRARELTADGIHLGVNDEEITKCRNYLGEKAIIGISCSDSKERALEYSKRGINYLSFGAFYPSITKQNARGRPNVSIIQWWKKVNNTLPCVAIGGITPQNCSILLQNDVDMLAVCAYIWQHPQGVVFAIRELCTCLENK